MGFWPPLQTGFADVTVLSVTVGCGGRDIPKSRYQKVTMHSCAFKTWMLLELQLHIAFVQMNPDKPVIVNKFIRL